MARLHHDPKFTGPVNGFMTERELLGYGKVFVPSRFENELPEAFRGQRAASAEQLALRCQDRELPLLDRLVAGQILGLMDDPRISTHAPAMVDVPGGRVLIGTSADEIEGLASRYASLGVDAAWLRKECPVHFVELRPFRLACFPVTNREYRDYLRDTGDTAIPYSWSLGRYPHERSNHPVHGIGPEAAERYTDWLSRITGRRFRLPLEAEWEFAAGGPSHYEFPWGNDFGADLANTAEAGLLTTTPVGIFPDGASPFGNLDMAGNVEEYVSEGYKPYPGYQEVIVDDLFEIDPAYRVARGGSFSRFRDLARCRRRHGFFPRPSIYVMGFRLAEDADAPPPHA